MGTKNLQKEIDILNKRINDLEHNRGLVTFIKKSLSKTNVIMGISITVIITTIIAFAAQTLFQDGEIISAQQVNDNFSELYSKSWEKNGNNLYYNNGSIGIGKDNPAASLDVVGSIAIDGNNVIDSNGEWVGGTSNITDTQISCDWTGWSSVGSCTECKGSCPEGFCFDYQQINLTQSYCDNNVVTQKRVVTCRIGGNCNFACPFLFSWNGNEYINDTTFIYKFDSPDKEDVQLRKLKYLDLSGEKIKAKVVEIDSETSYIDTISIVIRDKFKNTIDEVELLPIYASRDLNKILKSDDVYMITNQDDEVLLEFEKAPELKPGWTREVFVKAEGYYVFY